jgi:hypothetical protein
VIGIFVVLLLSTVTHIILGQNKIELYFEQDIGISPYGGRNERTGDSLRPPYVVTVTPTGAFSFIAILLEI